MVQNRVKYEVQWGEKNGRRYIESFEFESDIHAPIFIEKFETESLIADPTFLLRSKLHGVEDVPNQISGQNGFFHTDEF